MRGLRLATVLLAQAPWSSTSELCPAFQAGTSSQSWGRALFPVDRAALLHASISKGPSLWTYRGPVAGEGPPRHLADVPASEELRQLVAELREQERLRHRTRRESNGIQNGLALDSVDGFLPVYKPSDITSADVCRVVRHVLRTAGAHPPLRASGGLGACPETVGLSSTTAEHPPLHDHVTAPQRRKLRVGHGGTLDPAASGVLVVGIGRGTVALKPILNGSKEYVARVRLGTETDTLDADGEEKRQLPWEHVTHIKLAEVVASFKGRYLQQPPLFSAKRVRGRQLYKLARAGVALTQEEHPAPCLVTIEDIKLHRHDGVKLPDFDISVRCSKGTYIRQLAADIAAAVGTVAHLRLLVRTRQGPFAVEDCVSLERLSRYALVQQLVPL